MKRQSTSEKAALFTYFLVLIGVGTILLALPVSWKGTVRLSLLDASFTSVSAVCVTGLITVDTALYSRFGQTVILLLIQFGGWGILTFTTMFFVANRSKRISFRNLSMVRKYYLDSIEFQAHHILRNIILMSLSVELVGALLLWLRLRSADPGSTFFTALFHAVSAFCNAGFSLYSDSLSRFGSDPYLLILIMVLIVLGGLGFLVINDLLLYLRKKKRSLALHTKLVLAATVILILIGTGAYLLIERARAFRSFSAGKSLLNALFQSVTTRTAGFNVVDQGVLSNPSKVLTMLLMFIGGSPASIAGGIKTTTFAIVMLAIFKEIDWQGRIRIANRVLPSAIVTKSMLFLGKAAGILLLSVFLLSVTEMLHASGAGFAFLDIVFESFSAFGTVGLSTGITEQLSRAGKIIVIATMFAGRVGLISLSIPLFKEQHREIEYPEEEVLIG